MLKRLYAFLPLLAFAIATPLAAEDSEPLVMPELASTPLMTQETIRVIEMLETIHFKNEEITETAFQKLITEYLSDLDYNRLYFLQSDESLFHQTYGEKMGYLLRHLGDIAPAFEIFKVYRKHVVARTEWVLDRLNGEWSFDAEESYLFDRAKEQWPATQAEADMLWTKRLKQELLQELLNEKTIDEAKERISRRYSRNLRNLHEIDSGEVQEIFLTSLTQMFDPHSTFLSSKNFEDFNIQMRLSLVGIGALLSEDDGYCVVKELIPGGPAKRGATLKPEDRIVAVAQDKGEPLDIVGMSLRKVVDKIRGEKGTTVVLTVIPADAVDESERRQIAIVRDVVHINSSRCTAEVHEIPLANGSTMALGVIDIPSFYGSEEFDDKGNRVITSVTKDLEELLIKMRKENVQGIVLDLRRNGGGLLEEAIDMTGLFIKNGTVVQVKDPDGKVYAHSDRNPKVVYTGPLAVLTSRYSASASEIVAGALQNYGRALIIGNESTHGKGTVQQVLMLDDYVLRSYLSKEKAGAAKLTVRKFYLPNGFSTQRKGVISDITIPSIEEIVAMGEGELPNALAWDYINPARGFAEMNIKPQLLSELKKTSLDRQSKLKEFEFLAERIAWYKERKDRKDVSLNLDTRKTLMEDDKNFIDRLKEEQRSLAELNYTTRPVKLDSVIEDADGDEEPETASKDFNEADAAGLTRSDDEDEEPVPAFDIQLREGLRIMVDAIELSPNPSDWKETALPIASKMSAFDALVN